LFINGRFFQDNVINKVIQQQTGPDTSDDSKCNIIYIEAPKAEVDINVHPNKTSVKFLSISIVLSLINDCLKQNVYDTNNNGISLNTKRIDNLPTKSSDYFIHGHNQEFVEANGWSSNISQITDEFFLLEQNNQKYIVSKTKLLTNFLTNKWIKQLPIEPHNTIPLLISTPFNCERDFSKEQLQAISNLGFEFSKIDTKKYLLKSYPEVFPLEFAKVIAEMVLNNKSTPTILSEQFNLSIQTISNVFEQTNLTNQEKSFYKLLTNDSIKSFLEVEKKNE
jgi:DNA mismatch repair ATPase MutL